MLSHHHHPHHHHLYGAVPVGTVCAYAGLIETQGQVRTDGQPVAVIERLGWLPCVGQAVPIARYPELYGALGSLYNDGTEKAGEFRIPDCRGRFLRAVDDGTQKDPDAGTRQGPAGASAAALGGVGSTQDHATQSHTHEYNTFTASEAVAEGTPVELLGPAGKAQTGDMHVDDHVKQETPPVSKKETRPINIAFNFIIRAR